MTHWKHAFKMFLKSLQHSDASDKYNLKIKPHILTNRCRFPGNIRNIRINKATSVVFQRDK